MSSEGNKIDDGPSEEASSQEENYEGNKSGMSENYDMRDFCPGIKIEAQDFDGKWYPAKVADVDWTENEILVHFENWNSKFDEWIPMDSSRLRSFPKPLVQPLKETVKFVKGEEVLAMWSPYQKYPATIQAVLANDRYDVLFYDGFLKRLKAHKISKADCRMVRTEVRNFSDIGTKEERRERKRKINVAELFHVNKRSKKKGLVHSKTQDMKTYPVNKSRAKSSVKKPLPVPEEKESAGDEAALAKQADQKTPVSSNSSLSRSLVESIPAAVKVNYIDGRTEMWCKQLYQRSEGRSAGKLDIVILNPQGRKFRSRNEIMKYCEENGIIYTHDAFDFSAKGRPKCKPVVQVPAKTEPTPEDTDKMLKKFRRKSQVEEVLTGTPATQLPPVPAESNNYPEDKVFIGDVEVVVENGKFICPVKVCSKHFRRENLLHMHVKHYHPEFSKYLDYTPSVTDLAYMRTVGSLETSDSSPSAPRKTVAAVEKIEKAPVKPEKAKTNSLVSDVSKEASKKSSQKSLEGQSDVRAQSKLSTATTPTSPSTNAVPEPMEEAKPPEQKSISETFQIFKNSTSADTNSQPVVQENKGSCTAETSFDATTDNAESLSSSSIISKAIKHSRLYRQRKEARIRGSFSDHIKRKKYGQDFSRSNYKLGRQQFQPQPTTPSAAQPVIEELSNSNTSSQAFPSPRTPKLQLSISNEASGSEKGNASANPVTEAPRADGTAVEETEEKSSDSLLKKELRVAARKSSGVKRKRFDSRSGRSRKKKVLFESLVYTKWRDSESRDSDCYRKVYQGSARRVKDKTGYISYLGRKDGVSSDEPNVELSCDLDHTEGTEDSKSPFTVENEKVEKLRRNEIINCLCGITEEDGLMIQCDLCLCWQHGHCMEIYRDADVPDKYICSICKNPFRGRSSMKYVHDQEWLKEGTLPCLSFRSKRDNIIEQRRNILKRSYDLSGSISLLSQVIHSLRVKVNIAEKKDHPKLWLWAKKWIEKKPTRLVEDVKDEKPVETGVSSGKTEGLLPGEEQQLPKVPEPEAPIDSAECRLNLLDHLIHYQTLIDARLSCIESLVAELESMQDDAVDDEGPDRYPRTKATIQMILRDLNTMKKIAAI
ncbi:UNVERIFIED_CONTAM: hypothetical protein PYX00_004362 [Menopon gallinae]|uniref:PHD finger protein 20 n=1 Tax=Menopon gallinae TaxID=328185 RepID=A0AAW2I3C5_9NEOP